MNLSSAIRPGAADWLKLPHAEPGNRIGLFGGSFNPPHSGHRLVATTVLKRLGLDQVWWFVTPGNPLKDHSDLAPLEMRLHMTNALADHPRMKVTAYETVLQTPFTARTIKKLRAMRPGLRFVWVMGADNLAGFHKWQDWRSILGLVPIAIVDRPGASLSVLSAPMAKAYEKHRLPEEDAALLPDMAPPIWTFLHTSLDDASSTDLRRSGS
ncbi:nicotinate-nucleotide adenylyltransferase [Roseibium hamelinense]|uniref:Probable nicotinate-nucleotide adenylyltransferase n=1 Tax=Roseibium hamelinense TaxID=150831 RepID=A0A562T2S7_9HYPH|nr:nicotinate-nucleotide adenylyltransferase [Roseibium hamelinense]MTI43784.1 nicotinate-nucleotide adenylyltransferase [Roseibium hamelinense]TWI87136.1 nicotinate-nucleotide adenylyltransferase [Roseibium hamelinense]